MLTEIEPVEKFATAVAEQTWGVFRKDPLMLVLASMVAGIVSVVTLGLLSPMVLVGLIDMVRKVQAGEPTKLADLFERFDALLPGLIALVVVALAAAIGFALLVVPGLLVLVFGAFPLHVIAFERSTSVDAIKGSIGLVKRNFLNVLVLLLGVSVLQAIGGAVVFGMLLSLPLSVVALTVAYQRLAHPGNVLSHG